LEAALPVELEVEAEPVAVDEPVALPVVDEPPLDEASLELSDAAPNTPP
jgi:hypothetical protein